MEIFNFRPPEIDDGSYLRIKQIRVVERATSPIVDHNIELTEMAKECSDWYRGKTLIVPREYLSLKLNPDRNNATITLGAFLSIVKSYKPGVFSGHAYAVRELEFTTSYLIHTLSRILVSSRNVFVESLKQLGAFFAAISDPAACALSEHDYSLRLDSRMAALVESFRGISRAFQQRENEIMFGAEKPKVDDEAMALIRDTNARVKRMEARDIKRGGREKSRELQEACFRYWEIGCTKIAVRNSRNGKPRYEDVFTYYKRELTEIGINDSDEFAKQLIRRQKRLSQSASAR